MLTGFFSALAAVGRSVGAVLSIIASIGRRRERADAERTGAAKQREVDQLEEIRKLEGQLDDAVNHDPDVWRDRARDRRF